MATKFNLKITTPAGTFTRTATKAYTHAVVHVSPRALEAFETRGTSRRPSGVHARWVKDRGFAVTWHSSYGAAMKAFAGPYMWDGSTAKLGVFPVEA